MEKQHVHEDGIIHLSTLDLIKRFLNKNKRFKNKKELPNSNEAVIPSNINVNHIAVILDGEVQEVIRAQNKLAALFLSEPTFVEFDPSVEYVHIGWKYDGEKFIRVDNE